MNKKFKSPIEKFIENDDANGFQEFLLTQSFTIKDLDSMYEYIATKYNKDEETVEIILEFISDTKETFSEEEEFNLNEDLSANLDSITLHMKDIREHDLLSADEEIKFATEYQKYNKILRKINEYESLKATVQDFVDDYIEENKELPILNTGQLSFDSELKLNMQLIKKELKVKIDNQWYLEDMQRVSIDTNENTVIQAIKKFQKSFKKYPLLKGSNEINFKRIIKEGFIDEAPLNIYIVVDGEPIKMDYLLLVDKVNVFKDKLVNSNLRLVISIAKKMAGKGLPLEDLNQEGSLGLMKAADKYNPKLGYRFSTYATWWIKQSIRRGIADQGRTIRLPVHRHEQISKVDKISRRLAEELNREPTLEELSEVVERELSISHKKLVHLLNNIHRTRSIDQKVSDDNNNLIKDYITDESKYTPELSLLSQDLKDKLLELFNIILDEREKTILILRHGIHSSGLSEEKEYTLQDIGTILGLTRERIRQIEIKALKKLRHPVCQKFLSGYQIRKTQK